MNERRDALVERAGEAFADHLREPSPEAAEVLAHRLTELGLSRRASLLQQFASSGSHVSDANWWAPGARCHVSLALPGAAVLGDLWFDPLEVSLALAVPWVRDADVSTNVYDNVPSLLGWASVSPVAAWQLRGARGVAPHVPDRLSVMTGEQACAYCALFSKVLLGSSTWMFLRESYGSDTVRRLWSDSELELGNYGRISGIVEYFSLPELLSWRSGSDFDVRGVSELEVVGLPFRSETVTQLGLWVGDDALPRA